MRARMRKRQQCQHLYAASIHGDQINDMGGKRGVCYDCGTVLEALPFTFLSPSTSHRIIPAHLMADAGWESPVGICDDQGCRYAEPHRHGFACNKPCACRGVGPETRPLGDYSIRECDWGGCDRPARCERRSYDHGHLDDWLPVCSWHAGWDDHEGGA